MPPSASVAAAHETRGTVGRADVGDDRDAAVSDGGRRVGQTSGITSADGDPRPFRRQGHRRSEPEPRRCRRNRGPTTGQSEIHRPHRRPQPGALCAVTIAAAERTQACRITIAAQ